MVLSGHENCFARASHGKGPWAHGQAKTLWGKSMPLKGRTTASQFVWRCPPQYAEHTRDGPIVQRRPHRPGGTERHDCHGVVVVKGPPRRGEGGTADPLAADGAKDDGFAVDGRMDGNGGGGSGGGGGGAMTISRRHDG